MRRLILLGQRYTAGSGASVRTSMVLTPHNLCLVFRSLAHLLAHTVWCVDEREEPQYAELLRLLESVDGWLIRIDPNGQRPYAASGSPLRADDERTHPYETSHGAWHALSHAVDHLHCLRSVLRDARIVHMYAPYSLVRAALENASAAVWMLYPASRTERITRRLRFAAVDIRNGEQAKALVGTVGPRSEEERLDQVREIARCAGADPADATRKVGYREIVNGANQALAPSSKAVPFAWKLCSGIAHGDFWTTITAAERAELPDAPAGMGSFRLSANLKNLMYVTSFAIHMTRRGWHLYNQRSRGPKPLMIVQQRRTTHAEMVRLCYQVRVAGEQPVPACPDRSHMLCSRWDADVLAKVRRRATPR